MGIRDFAKQLLDVLDLYYYEYDNVVPLLFWINGRRLLYLLRTVWVD